MAQPVRRNRSRATAAVIAAVTALTALAVVALEYYPALRPQITLHSAASPSPPAPANDGPWTDVDDVEDALERQGNALISGDEAGWLELIDPANAALVKQFRGYYDALRALQVNQWYASPDDSIIDVLAPDVAPAGFTVDVFFGYCWQSKICPPTATRSGYSVDGFTAEVSWRLADDRYLVSKVTLPKKLPWYENHPWLTTTMRSTVRGPVTVFASTSSKVDLADVAKRAEAAATAVSGYGRWMKPDRFLVYVANETEWKKWFGGPPGVNVIGVAIPTAMYSISIVLRSEKVAGTSLDHLLRHELGHVVTLLGSSGRGPEYLIEGIAEWIANDGRNVSSYDRLENVRRYFQSGRWKGDLDSLDPYADDPLAGSAGYGAGYLTWKCIETKYGLEKMWGFATIALREDDGAVKGAPGQLGASWSAVKKQCVEYIKSVY